jgi:hypothetical protein
LHARLVVSPPLRFEEMLWAAWGLCALGRARRDGLPRGVDAILMAAAFADEIELCSPPRWVQRAAVRLLAPAARATGRSVLSDAVMCAAIVDPGHWPAP